MYRPYLSDPARDIPEPYLDAAIAQLGPEPDAWDVTELAAHLYAEARRDARDYGDSHYADDLIDARGEA